MRGAIVPVSSLSLYSQRFPECLDEAVKVRLRDVEWRLDSLISIFNSRLDAKPGQKSFNFALERSG